MNIGGSDTDSKRNTISIGYNMILASKMVSIYGGVSWHSFWLNHSVVNTYSRPGSLLCVVQFLQNGVVNIWKNTVSLPFPKFALAGDTFAVRRLLWKIFPRNVGIDYKDGADQGGSIRIIYLLLGALHRHKFK